MRRSAGGTLGRAWRLRELLLIYVEDWLTDWRTIKADPSVNNGRVDTADVLLAVRAVLQSIMLDDKQFALGDLAPRVSGQYTPNGEFNAADLLLIQRAALQ